MLAILVCSTGLSPSFPTLLNAHELIYMDPPHWGPLNSDFRLSLASGRHWQETQRTVEYGVRDFFPNSRPDGGMWHSSCELHFWFYSTLPFPFRCGIQRHPTLNTPEKSTLTCFCYCNSAWTFIKCLFNKTSSKCLVWMCHLFPARAWADRIIH